MDQETNKEQHLVDTGDGYWISYEDWKLLAWERENFKKQIKDLQIDNVDLKAKLQATNEKIDMYKESLKEERIQADITINAQQKFITRLETKLQLKDDKITLLEENNQLKDIQISNWKVLYKDKPPGVDIKLKWGGGGLAAGVILGLLAGINAAD